MPSTTENQANAPGQQARRRPFSTLTEAEQWDWHADVYAFRRVMLDSSDSERTSPCDPDGVWFDEARVILAAARYRRKFKDGAARHSAAHHDRMQREGRGIINAWAQRKGYEDVDAYADAMGIHWSDAYLEYSREAGLVARRMPTEPKSPS